MKVVQAGGWCRLLNDMLTNLLGPHICILLAGAILMAKPFRGREHLSLGYNASGTGRKSPVCTKKEIDEQFMLLNSAAVQEYDAELKDWTDQLHLREQRLQRQAEETHSILHDFRIDIKRLEEQERRDAEELEEYLEKTRPGLVDRTVDLKSSFKESSVYSAAAGQAGAIPIDLYAASETSPDASRPEGLEGQRDKPLVIYYDPKIINSKHLDKGSGWGCRAAGIPFPTYANLWFFFMPSKTAWWEFNALVAFHGFYILKASNKWYNCKHAHLDAKVLMRVYQYHWHPWKSFTLIDESDRNIDVYNFYDKLDKFTYTAPLKSGDPVWIQIRIGLRAHARGNGSYAEINFSDGGGNTIGPAILLART